MSEDGNPSGMAAAPPDKRVPLPREETEAHSRGDSPPRKKKQKTNGSTRSLSHSADINKNYMEQSFKDCFGSALKDGIEASHLATQASVTNNPFTCCVLPNFVRDEGFLNGLKEELLELDFNEKSNDLYKFQQSDALQNVTSPYVSALKKLLYEDFLSWLRDVTGIPFTDTFDLTCSKYSYTDVLLCHDDELEGRRVAFILYLVPPWEKADGGLLDLYDLDAHGQPESIVKSLVPQWNNFAFFEVTPKTFHQVSEIVNPDKCRLSVSGWFHGPTIPRPPLYIEPRNTLTPHVDIEESTLFEWISENYLDLVNQSEVQDMFSDESEIQLSLFFEKEKFDAVHAALQSPDVRWKKRGPANKRHYESADLDTLPPIIQECLGIMQSEYVFLLLSNFTALRLHEQAQSSDDEDGDEGDDEREEAPKEEKEEMTDEGDGERGDAAQGHGEEGETGEDGARKSGSGGGSSHGNGADKPDADKGVVVKAKPKSSIPRCRAEVRRWTHGSYTLLHDTDTEGSEFALDASVFFNTDGLDPEHGGFVSYIAKGEDEELLSVLPEDNSLSLVYRDKDTLRFVKHINHSFTNSRGGDDDAHHSQAAFYELYFVYYE